MPHCWPQKQQWVLTSLSGSTLVDSRSPVIADRCGPNCSMIFSSSTGIVAMLVELVGVRACALSARVQSAPCARPKSARRHRGQICW